MPGKRIKHYRKSLGLSELEMAQKLHLSMDVYQRIGEKEENLTIGQLKIIASILKVSVMDLLPDELIIGNSIQQKL